MTTVADAPQANAFEHVAVIHDGPGELAARVAPGLRTAVSTGDAVLVCLDDLAWEHVSAELGTATAGVTFTPARTRYSRPAAAMALLHRFVQEALDRGAGAVWSLGAISFDGTATDTEWHRYEAAANEVFRDVPVKGICSYDTSTTSAAVIDVALRTHALVDDGAGRRTSSAYSSEPFVDAERSTGAALLEGLGNPDQLLVVDRAAVARHALATAYRSALDASRLDDVLLSATELVSNGLRHGRPPVTLESWCTSSGDVLLRVCDTGDGIADPYPELRPPAAGLGGYGLWVVGQVCDDLFVDRVDGRTVVTARLRGVAST